MRTRLTWVWCSIGVALILVHTSLAAQAPRLRPSASLDVAALTVGEIRASVEPLVLKRSAFGVSLARWWGGQTIYAVPLSSQLVAPAPGVDAPHPAREYMVDVYARVYPLSFASASPKHRINGYLGGFVGYHRREFDQTIYPPVCVPTGTVVCPLAAPAGSAIACLAPCPAPQTTRLVANGVEPGAEIGVRAEPWGDVFVELGGWARLITFSDPTGRFEQGQVTSRLTVAVGVGW